MSGFNLTAILQILTTVIIGIIGFFIKRELKKLEEADNENKNKIQALEKDMYKKFDEIREDCKTCKFENIEKLNFIKDDMSKEFVRKVDYLQTTGEIMKKLDKIFDILFELKGRDKC